MCMKTKGKTENVELEEILIVFLDLTGARKAKLKIRDHYAEVLVSLEIFLEYYQAL